MSWKKLRLDHSFQSQESVFQISRVDPTFQERSNTDSKNTLPTKESEIDTVISRIHPLGLDLAEQEEEIAELKAIIEQLKLVSQVC